MMFRSLGFLSRKSGPLVGIVAILLIQNLAIFYNHYFRGYAFPWDFLGSYHALPYYWIEAAKLGVDTAWIPFQGMGYPLYLNLQSGAFYPPFWLLVILGKTYSVETAVLMQGLHVWFGAVGAVICARLLGLKWKESLLVGVFYQAFGAFYSNASHPDIVRTYALLPWLCAPVFSRWHEQSMLQCLGIMSLPLWTYCLWTGGYPGGAVAMMFVLGTTLLLRILLERDNRNTGLLVLLALAAGCLLAGISLLPGILSASEVARASQAGGGLVYDYLSPGDVFALIYRVDNTFFGHDITMRSVFVGVPVVALLLLGAQNCRHWNRWVLFTVAISLAMASGILHKFIVGVFPPLGYSRFAFADYRGFIGLALILIAVQGGGAQDQNNRGAYLWGVALLAFVVFGNYLLKLNMPDNWRDVGFLMLVIAAVLVVLGYVRHKNNKWVIPLLIAVALLDWARVNGGQGYFNFSNANAWVEEATGKFVDTEKALAARLLKTDDCRPSRIDIPELNWIMRPWRGYYTGKYMMEDYSGPMKFVRQQQILASPSLRAFASRPWVAVDLLETGSFGDGLLMEAPLAPVSCIRYGTTRIEYRVDLPQPRFVVENELFWKGWSATVFSLDGRAIEILEPINVKGFRGWRLPAGNYTLVATFETPNRNWGRLVTAVGVFLWLGLGVLLWRRPTWKLNVK